VIENAFAGLAIAFSRLINIGDTVLLGERYGTVEDISVTHTTIRLWDWRRCVIPNSKMLQSEVINYSLHDRFQWAYVEFWVNYDADLKKVAELAAEACKASAHFAPYEPPVFWVMDLAERGICCWIAAWADSPSSAWVLKCDMRATLVRAFAEHGICPHTYHVEAAARGA
jgi:small-conductance mechanosensitive channel